MRNCFWVGFLVALLTTPVFASAQDFNPAVVFSQDRGSSRTQDSEPRQLSQSRSYVGGNYVFVTYEEDGVVDDIDFGVMVGKFGAQIVPYFAVEFRMGFGVSKGTEEANGFSYEFEVDHLVGGYGVLGLPNHSPVYPYAVLGFTKGKMTATARGFGVSISNSVSESDLSFGLGANFAVNSNVQMNAEYMNYMDIEGSDITGISLGIAYLF